MIKTEDIFKGLDDTPEVFGYEPLTEGKYKCRVESVEVREAASGLPYLVVRYANAEGYVREWLYFTEKAIKQTVRKLIVAGWNPVASKWNIVELVEKGPEILNQELTVTVFRSDFNDKTNYRVENVKGDREKDPDALKIMAELKKNKKGCEQVSKALTDRLNKMEGR